MDNSRSRVLIKIFIILFSLVVLAFNFFVDSEQQFIYLADSFLHGKLFFIQEPGSWVDTTLWNGKHYWPLGPFPAILLMPFVALFKIFGIVFYQGYLQFFLTTLIFYLIFHIARTYKYSVNNALFWGFAFVFASTFINVALIPWSWWFAQVVTVALLYLIIYEHLHQNRLLLIGAGYGLLLLTRVTSVITILYFLLTIVTEKKKIKDKIRSLILLLIPFIGGGVVMALFNYYRFGNFFEQGYRYQTLLNDSFQAARDYGLFNISHIPGNLYYFLLSGPLPVYKDNVSHVLQFPFIKANPWGMSLFFTSPYLIWLFSLSYKDVVSKKMLLVLLIAVFTILCYYGIGYRQYGYRYALDFYPFLFWLFIRNYQLRYKNLSSLFKLTIIVSAIINLFLLPSIFFKL